MFYTVSKYVCAWKSLFLNTVKSLNLLDRLLRSCLHVTSVIALVSHVRLNGLKKVRLCAKLSTEWIFYSTPATSDKWLIKHFCCCAKNKWLFTVQWRKAVVSPLNEVSETKQFIVKCCKTITKCCRASLLFMSIKHVKSFVKSDV